MASLNMPAIFVTFDTFQLVISSLNDDFSLNKSCISVTWDTSHSEICLPYCAVLTPYPSLYQLFTAVCIEFAGTGILLIAK